MACVQTNTYVTHRNNRTMKQNRPSKQTESIYFKKMEHRRAELLVLYDLFVQLVVVLYGQDADFIQKKLNSGYITTLRQCCYQF